MIAQESSRESSVSEKEELQVITEYRMEQLKHLVNVIFETANWRLDVLEKSKIQDPKQLLIGSRGGGLDYMVGVLNTVADFKPTCSQQF